MGSILLSLLASQGWQGLGRSGYHRKTSIDMLGRAFSGILLVAFPPVASPKYTVQSTIETQKTGALRRTEALERTIS